MPASRRPIERRQAIKYLAGSALGLLGVSACTAPPPAATVTPKPPPAATGTPKPAAASPAAASPVASPSPAASPLASPSPAAAAPAPNFAALGKDPRMRPYGAFNAGTLLEETQGIVTPNPLFYMVSRGAQAPFMLRGNTYPQIADADYRLRIDGLVNGPVELTLAELKALPNRTLTAFLECGGNSRERFEPTIPGPQFGNDLVSNAEWTGVSVSEAIKKAGGLKAGAVEVMAYGGDADDFKRAFPAGLVDDPDLMVVWEMNGQPLPLAHGKPARLLAPGWAGVASIKYLVRLEALDRPSDAFLNVQAYRIVDADDKDLEPVTVMPVKSVIHTPKEGAALRAGPTSIEGFAWSGDGKIAKVEVSTDDGTTWQEAKLVDGTQHPRSWVAFEQPWDAKAGPFALRSRATDAKGTLQPETIPFNKMGHRMNAIQTVKGTVA